MSAPLRPTALIADDEPLLRQSLRRSLGAAWPDLEIVAEARNGREALALCERHRPTVCFLDIHMPGMSGIEVAQQLGSPTHTVFVTAFDEYAVDAFRHGALDYLVKPVDADRLALCVERLQCRLAEHAPSAPDTTALDQLARRLMGDSQPEQLRWIRAQTGQTVRMISVDDIDYFRADAKYTRVAWRNGAGVENEALIRLPIRELVEKLPADSFAQIHRSAIVSLSAISHVVRGENETGQLHLRGRSETLPVSRAFMPQFKQM